VVQKVHAACYFNVNDGDDDLSVGMGIDNRCFKNIDVLVSEIDVFAIDVSVPMFLNYRYFGVKTSMFYFILSTC
jgi:hypothetical protein